MNTDRGQILPPGDIEPLVPTAAFVEAVGEMGLVLEPREVESLGRYLAVLLMANEAVNLTAITDPGEAWMRHIFDALTLVPLIGEVQREEGEGDGATGGEGLRVMDVGSGGGVPGIPLAIAMPEVRFWLLEPTGKKAKFLGEAVERLGLANVTVLADRAERLGQDRRTRESFDCVVSRAVGNLNMLAELTIPLAKRGGLVLCIKGAKAEEELAAAAGVVGMLGARHAGTVETKTGRVLVLEKASLTPKPYPRRDGEPKRAPLK